VSWYQLLSIRAETVAWRLQEYTEPPLACPYDGEPLRSMPDGGVGLYCPLGNYEWPRQPRII
jgi:hypothetical protein